MEANNIKAGAAVGSTRTPNQSATAAAELARKSTELSSAHTCEWEEKPLLTTTTTTDTRKDEKRIKDVRTMQKTAAW